MVSAAKLRRSQDAIVNQRPYAKKIRSLISLVRRHPKAEGLATRLLESDLGLKPESTKVLLVLMSSDRGLCGGFNANIIKGAARWMKANSNYAQIDLAFVGRKAFDFYKTKHPTLGPNWTHIQGKVTYPKARKIGEELVQLYLTGKYQKIVIVFNEFKNAITQQTMFEQMLPFEGSMGTDELGEQVLLETSLIQPSFDAVIEMLLKKHFSTQIFRMLLESQASEHGSRMSAMENATRNASEMIKKLTLQYNKQRQAGITKELLEIISGAESAKSG